MQKLCQLLFIIVLIILLSGSVGYAMADSTNAAASVSMQKIIIASVLSLAVLGLIFGCGLGIASKVFEVKTDPKVAEISEILPQVNCGACGYAGCTAFAEAVVKGGATPTGCLPGGPEVAKSIGMILGVAVDLQTPPVATILCTRKKGVKKRGVYDGISDCRAAVTLGENIYECAYACLGLGTCARVCPFDAIYMNQEEMPAVVEERCTACGLCVENCPVNIIRLTPRDHYVHILCVSTEPIKIRAKVHKPGACIGCRKCVKTCPYDAISMINGVAVIDYQKCTNCEKCIPVCPTTAIHKVRPGVPTVPENKEEISAKGTE